MEMKSAAAARTSWSSSCSSVNRLPHKDSVAGRPVTHGDRALKNLAATLDGGYVPDTHPVAAESCSTHFLCS